MHSSGAGHGEDDKKICLNLPIALRPGNDVWAPEAI